MYHASLSTTDTIKVFSIIEESMGVHTEFEFKNLLNKIKILFGQEMAACGIGDIRSLKVLATVNAGFSADFMATIVDSSGQMRSPLFHQWMANQSPQILNFKRNLKIPRHNGTSLYNDFSLRNVISHGIVECSQHYASYFGFAQIPERLGPQHEILMSILAPHLHISYARLRCVKATLLPVKNVDSILFKNNGSKNILQNRQHTEIEELSARELEVLNWLFEGKSNWGIGEIMHISESTVKNHVQNILKKFSVNSRQHAVAKAIKIGLVKLQ